MVKNCISEHWIIYKLSSCLPEMLLSVPIGQRVVSEFYYYAKPVIVRFKFSLTL